MKTIIVGFTEETKTRVLKELKLHMRHEIIDEDAAISEVFDRVSDRVEGSHEPTFEISRSETKSGNSILIDFLANDFTYEIKETKMENKDEKARLQKAFTLAYEAYKFAAAKEATAYATHADLSDIARSRKQAEDVYKAALKDLNTFLIIK